MDMKRNYLSTTVLPLLLSISFSFPLRAQTSAQPGTSQGQSSQTQTAEAHTIPSLDGGIGPCTADFLITDPDNKPVYNATIKVHIAYGTWSVRKLDLQISTNIDGKARFTGLPNKIKHGILFHASEGNRVGEAFDDPANTCKAQFPITIRQPD